MDTREKWLQKAAHEMGEWIGEATDIVVPDVYVSVGFGTGSKCQLDKVLGACWKAEYSADGKPQVFVSPLLYSEPWAKDGVLAVLLHELCHAAVGVEAKHGLPFRRVAEAIGLLPPWRSTNVSEGLAERLKGLAESLGKFPHAPMTLPEQAKRKTATVLLGVPAGREARIVIPSEKANGEPLGAAFVLDVLMEAAQLFGGYTAFVASGGFIAANGEVKTEAVCVLDVATDNKMREALESLALHIKLVGEQESVYLRLPDGKVELI